MRKVDVVVLWHFDRHHLVRPFIVLDVVHTGPLGVFISGKVSTQDRPVLKYVQAFQNILERESELEFSLISVNPSPVDRHDAYLWVDVE